MVRIVKVPIKENEVNEVAPGHEPAALRRPDHNFIVKLAPIRLRLTLVVLPIVKLIALRLTIARHANILLALIYFFKRLRKEVDGVLHLLDVLPQNGPML